MKVELQIEENTPEKHVIIISNKLDEEVQHLIRLLSDQHPQLIAGFRENQVKLLEQREIIRIYASGGRVFAVTDTGEFLLRLRLYELEERLVSGRFVRISNSEIINLGKAKDFDLSYTGTIRVNLQNGDAAFVSRRYVSRIRKTLGI